MNSFMFGLLSGLGLIAAFMGLFAESLPLAILGVVGLMVGIIMMVISAGEADIWDREDDDPIFVDDGDHTHDDRI